MGLHPKQLNHLPVKDKIEIAKPISVLDGLEGERAQQRPPVNEGVVMNLSDLGTLLGKVSGPPAPEMIGDSSEYCFAHFVRSGEG